MNEYIPIYFLLIACIVVTNTLAFPQNYSPTIVTKYDNLFSVHLNRKVQYTTVSPTLTGSTPWSVLIVFDGQDFPSVRVEEALYHFYAKHTETPVLLVGVHADKDRIFEYGTASQPDYANRGNKANLTTAFVIKELIPFLKEGFPLSERTEDWGVAGFSLGGLMALDLAWHHPDQFAKVGVFSGSFWWRQKALDDGYHDSDRIMHRIISETPGKPKLKFWFQTGTLDETDDRDGDGIIDSIDDTLDLIATLERKQYSWGQDIRYLEVEGGEHNQGTWAKVFPGFLDWCF